MSKRGLSADEKRKRMMDFFHEKQDFFQLKDIEKLCSQEKGITIQTVKDVLASLVDDGLVESEKIGTSIYYWSLPSRALNKRQESIKKIEQELKNEKEKSESYKKSLANFETSEDDEEKRDKLLDEYKDLVDKRQKLLKELEALKENDPETYQKSLNTLTECKKSCNRWVENIFSLKSWLKNKFRIDESVINKQFEIPDDLDYVE
uniref:Meiotic nuclear division protein 1 homolog n=1 Tax=Brachionus calyciflorus TaxID=104777 RepID=M4SIU1_9BILA|nr:Mnd1 [Brachionus calyciflorus]